MATLCIDMPSGIAGDMLLAALLQAGGDLPRLQRDLTGLGLGSIGLTATPVLVGGLSALRVAVAVPQVADWQQIPAIAVDLRAGSGSDRLLGASMIASTAPAIGLAPAHGHGHAHGHRPYRDIRTLLEHAALAPRVRKRALAVFRLLAEAEAAVHGVDPETVEFHEVGSADAIVDVVGCCLLLEQLAIDRVVAGPLVPGHGTVQCAHGRMPVPVPAVARMLDQVLLRSGVRAPWKTLPFETGELTTPTGAALVCALADEFTGGDDGAAQVVTTRAVGYGAGTKTIPRLVNVVRVTVVESATEIVDRDEVAELACQVDDMTGEHLGLLMEDLLAAGALDVWCAPVLMKKGRPGHALTVLTRIADEARLADLVLTRSTTIGLRHARRRRTVLPRSEATVTVAGHPIRLKVVTAPDGTRRAKPEADDVAACARTEGRSPSQIQDLALAAWRQSGG